MREHISVAILFAVLTTMVVGTGLSVVSYLTNTSVYNLVQLHKRVPPVIKNSKIPPEDTLREFTYNTPPSSMEEDILIFELVIDPQNKIVDELPPNWYMRKGDSSWM